MTANEDLNRENKALRERISALSAASLRVGSTLDVDTLLHEIAESARVLIAARYAAITTIDNDGELEYVVLSGLTPEEERQIEAWDDNMNAFDALRNLPSPLRVADMSAYLGTLGLSVDGLIISTFQGAPMRHRDEQIGNFFLGDKEGGREFTDEDEELLVLFASQAAAAIANARTFRAEQRARADLEALVETSPFGVLVFRVPTGHPVSANREARRIMDGLRIPGQSNEQLIQTITCHFADGSEIALDQFPIWSLLGDAQTLRAEEVALATPDGRSATVLVNVTPIRSSEGTLESVVVTVQDLAPLDELERQRAEFLDMVSHELRAPLSAVKGSAATLVEASASLDRAEMRAFSRIIVEHADHMRALISDLLDAGRIDSGTLSVTLEPTELSALVDRARNTFLSSGTGHDVLIDLAPGLPTVMAHGRRIAQVLNNLLSNAARNSSKHSPILIRVVRDGGHVAIAVHDQGRGIAPEQLAHLFRKHVRVEPEDAGLGVGSGLGLSICKGLVEAHGGRIRAESGGPGQGASFTFTIPIAEETPDTAQAVGTGRSATPLPPAERRPRILVLDDDPQALRFVRVALADAGYEALVCDDHRNLPALIDVERPHLVVLDLMLPDTDGIELMQRVPQLADQPVIFISAYGREETIAKALSSGAADYIVKPFTSTELVARVRAALHRRTPERFVLGDLVIHHEDRRVTLADRTVDLTATEFELLRALSLNAGQVLTYEALQRQVWNNRGGGDPDVVRVFIQKLRRKLSDDPKQPVYIFNHRGIGYRMARTLQP